MPLTEQELYDARQETADDIDPDIARWEMESPAPIPHAADEAANFF